MKKLIPLLIAAVVLSGCGRKAPAMEETKKEVPTCKVSFRTVQASVEATGTVQPDQEGGAKILTPLAGSVEKLFVNVGDSVRRGTPLAAVRTPDVSDAHANLYATQAQLKQTERSYELNKKLYDIGAVTKNDLLASEANMEQSKALVDGLKKKLEVFGASSGSGARDTIVVRAPISGRVVDIQAHIGDRFDTATPLLTVANSTRSLIVANIYDTDIGKFGKGQEVSFTSDVFPSETFKGTITYVSDVEDPDTKTVKTYIKPLSGNTLFRQNMFLKIRIIQGEAALPVVAKSSIIYRDGKFFAQVKKNGAFELKQVKPVRDVSDKLMAVEGLAEGDVIACSAIDLEQP